MASYSEAQRSIRKERQEARDKRERIDRCVESVKGASSRSTMGDPMAMSIIMSSGVGMEMFPLGDEEPDADEMRKQFDEQLRELTKKPGLLREQCERMQSEEDLLY